MQVYDSAEKTTSNDIHVLMLMEFCNGTLFNFISEREERFKTTGVGITEHELLKILSDVTSALTHMHMQDRPIAHRDIKIENILRGTDGSWKLCDFGSCSTRQIENVLPHMRSDVEYDIEKSTTPLYRAPEQLDFYLGYKIGERVDVWALGCVLYTLMFFKSPFNENERLNQKSGKVRYPAQSPYSMGLMRLL